MRCDATIRAGLFVGVTLIGAILASGVCDGRAAVAQTAQPGGAAQSTNGQPQTPESPSAKETSVTTKKAMKASAKEAKKAAKSSARLPAHFRSVVTEEQRQKIYAIQKDYEAKIDPLRRQVQSLTDEQEEKINALLTPEQKQKIEALKAAAAKSKMTKKATKEMKKDATS